jgi:hypothetical protein
MNILFFSVHSDDLNPEIPKYQKLVFEKFNLEIFQSVFKTVEDNYRQHGRQIDHVLRTTKYDYYVIFDVDCVPLNVNFYKRLVDNIQKDILCGAIGCANHIDQNRLYVHPCFMGFSRNLYERCGSPDFEHSNIPPHYGDTGQLFSDKCDLKYYWNVTSNDDDKWDLKPLNTKFGHGTIYENEIYHRFQIAEPIQQQYFIDKCKSILHNSIKTIV